MQIQQITIQKDNKQVNISHRQTSGTLFESVIGWRRKILQIYSNPKLNNSNTKDFPVKKNKHFCVQTWTGPCLSTQPFTTQTHVKHKKLYGPFNIQQVCVCVCNGEREGERERRRAMWSASPARTTTSQQHREGDRGRGRGGGRRRGSDHITPVSLSTDSTSLTVQTTWPKTNQSEGKEMLDKKQGRRGRGVGWGGRTVTPATPPGPLIVSPHPAPPHATPTRKRNVKTWKIRLWISWKQCLFQAEATLWSIL